jgi:hypothetical protein
MDNETKQSQMLIFNNNPTLQDVEIAEENLNLIICRIFEDSIEKADIKHHKIIQNIGKPSFSLCIDFNNEPISQKEYEDKIKSKFNKNMELLNPQCSWKKGTINEY